MPEMQPEIDFGGENNISEKRPEYKQELYSSFYEISKEDENFLTDFAKLLEIKDLSKEDIIKRGEIGPFSIESTQDGELKIEADEHDVSYKILLKELVDATKNKTTLKDGKNWSDRYNEISKNWGA